MKTRIVDDSAVKTAASIGESFASNVTRIRNAAPQINVGSTSFFHAKNAKQISGVQELGDLAIKLSTTGTILRNAGTCRNTAYVQP